MSEQEAKCLTCNQLAEKDWNVLIFIQEPEQGLKVPKGEIFDEFKFIFETILDYESGDQMGSFDAKKTPSKISCLGTFNVKSVIMYFYE